MRERGVVMTVNTIPVGDELAVAASAGATTLTLTDTADFYEPEADQTITIGSETIVYTDADADTDVITLASPLANAYGVGEEVLLTGSTVVAKVNVSTSSSDPVTCIVPSAIIDQLNGNVYDAVGLSVLVEEDPESEDMVVLQIDDEVPEIAGQYLALPRIRLTKGTTSTGSGTAGTQVGWDSAEIDTDGWWDSGSPGFVVPTYNCHALVACDMIWATNGTNLRALWVEESSNAGGSWSTVLALQHFQGALNNENTICRFAQMVPLTAGNFYRVMRYQNSGAALNFTSARLTITLFGPK